MSSTVRMSRLPHLVVGALAAWALSAVALTGVARADRKSILDGQPAVRHRVLLVKRRFELTPTFESSINADFRHTLSGGLKLEYHFSDMWSFGAMGYFGTSVNTGLTSRILDTLPETNDAEDPTPTQSELEEHLNSIPMHGAAFVTWTPWYGKLAAFGSAFVAFDFYFNAGLSVATLKNECCSFQPDPFPEGNLDPPNPDDIVLPDKNPNNDDPLNDGTRFGLFLGGGIHVFLNEFIALDLSFRDYWFQDNPSGLDFDADLAVTDEDDRFLNHFSAGIGISIFLPARAKRTP